MASMTIEYATGLVKNKRFRNLRTRAEKKEFGKAKEMLARGPGLAQFGRFQGRAQKRVAKPKPPVPRPR